MEERLADRFQADRAHLRGVAYRLTGSLEDADDAVQRAWLKASRSDLREVRNLTGWLTTVTARECLDLLRARRRRREVPLPAETGYEAASPVRRGDEEVLLAEEVGLALLVVLDRLSPAQRVAFVLHEAFSVPFDEIGQVLGRSPVAAKKLASRARQRVHGRGASIPRPGGQRPSAADLRLAEAFLAASRDGDMTALLGLLAPDVIRTVDRDLVPGHVASEVRGAGAVAEETRLFAHRARTGAVALIDGTAGIVIAPRGRLLAALRLTIRSGRIHRIDIAGAGRLAGLTITVPG